jgi:hypothetical protein
LLREKGTSNMCRHYWRFTSLLNVLVRDVLYVSGTIWYRWSIVVLRRCRDIVQVTMIPWRSLQGWRDLVEDRVVAVWRREHAWVFWWHLDCVCLGEWD